LYKAEITKEIYARQAQQQMTNTINLKVMNKALPADFDYARLEVINFLFVVFSPLILGKKTCYSRTFEALY